MISAKPNMPIAIDDEVDAVGELRNAEAVARDAGIDVGADQAEHQTEHHHGDRLEERAVASTTDGNEPSTISEKYSAGPNSKRDLGERRREQRDQHGRDRAGEERADRGDRQRSARPCPAAPSGSRRARSRPRTIRPAG